MISIVIIGTGNVAYHLHKRFSQEESISCTQISSRNIKTVPPADIAIIAVSDDAIVEVSKKVDIPLVAHTSGAQEIGILKNSNRKAVFYPLQSFTKSKNVDFKEVPICLEANAEEDYQILENLAKTISNRVYRISSKQREMVHVAAVFANNFTNHMLKLSKHICDVNEIPFEVLQPLIQETFEKSKSLGPEQSQTGPAIRKDSKTIEKHVFLLPKNLKKIYRVLTDSIQDGEKL